MKTKKIKLLGKDYTIIKPSNLWLLDKQDQAMLRSGIIDKCKYAKSLLTNLPEQPQLEDFREWENPISIEIGEGKTAKTFTFELSLEQALILSNKAFDERGNFSNTGFLIEVGKVAKINIDEDFRDMEDIKEFIGKYQETIKTNAIDEVINAFESFR